MPVPTGSTTIYSDFSHELAWLREVIGREVPSFPPGIRPVVLHYLRDRLTILPGGRPRNAIPLLGKPVPYAIFWFADALGFTDAERVKRLALGLVYISLHTTIKDDLVDDLRLSPRRRSHFLLASHYFDRYVSIFEEVFPPGHRFWSRFRTWRDGAARYDDWNSRSPDPRIDALSTAFLADSSRYFVAVVLPSLAALAMLAGRDDAIEPIRRFLRHFSMAWRIFDDLSDWERDLGLMDGGHSTVLRHACELAGTDSVTRGIVLSSFMNAKFVEGLYGQMLAQFAKARREIRTLRNPYLSRFMDEQVEFHTRMREELLRSGYVLRERLSRAVDGSIDDQQRRRRRSRSSRLTRRVARSRCTGTRLSPRL